MNTERYVQMYTQSSIHRKLCEWYSKRPKWNWIAALCGEKSNSNNNAIVCASARDKRQEQQAAAEPAPAPATATATSTRTFCIYNTPSSIHNLIVAKHFGFIWARKICERTFPLLLYCAMALSRFNCMWWASRVVRNYMYISFALLLPSTQCLFSVFGVYCVCSFFVSRVCCSRSRASESGFAAKREYIYYIQQRKAKREKKSAITIHSTQILSKFCCVSGTAAAAALRNSKTYNSQLFFPYDEDSLWLVDKENERESAVRTHLPHSSKLPQHTQKKTHFQFCPSKKYH